MFDRRALLPALAGAVLLTSAPAAVAASAGDLRRRLAALETRSGGRLGLFVLDAAKGAGFGYRADERFAMCSTFKALLAAAVLARVDAGAEHLDRRLDYAAADLLGHAPTARARLGQGLTIVEACEAAVSLSDNTAANLLLATLGGPAGLTAWLRRIGDRITRLDRWELDLNTALVGDPRDTTTPAAMARTLRAVALGHTLSSVSRERLVAWLVASPTGAARLRAGLPAGWRVGDKTGTGPDETGTSNDVAVLWRPDGSPAVVATFLTRSTLPGPGRDAILAEAGRIAGEVLA